MEKKEDARRLNLKLLACILHSSYDSAVIGVVRNVSVNNAELVRLVKTKKWGNVWEVCGVKLILDKRVRFRGTLVLYESLNEVPKQQL